jgi:hypothetical protein
MTGRTQPYSITRNSSASGKTLTLVFFEVEDTKKRLAGLKGQ